MLLGHWVKLEWLELMEMQTRATRIGFLETLAFPVVPVALAACHLPDVHGRRWPQQPREHIVQASFNRELDIACMVSWHAACILHLSHSMTTLAGSHLWINLDVSAEMRMAA